MKNNTQSTSNSYLPDVLVYEYINKDLTNAESKIKQCNFSDLIYKKKIIVIGVVGAFVPLCSAHLSGFFKIL